MSSISRSAGEDDYREARNLLVVIELQNSVLLKDATKARRWLETVIIEVYHLLGRVDIWTCRRNIVIQIDRRREDVPVAVIQALEYFPQTKVIPQGKGDDLMDSAILISLKSPFFAKATTTCFLVTDTKNRPAREAATCLSDSLGDLERLFVLQAPDTFLSEDSRWRQFLAVEEVDLATMRHITVELRSGDKQGEYEAIPEGSGSSEDTLVPASPASQEEPDLNPSFPESPPDSVSPKLPGSFAPTDEDASPRNLGEIPKKASSESFVTALASEDDREPDIIQVGSELGEGIHGHTINTGGAPRLCTQRWRVRGVQVFPTDLDFALSNIEEFTGVQPIRKAFGRLPCLGYHIKGGCVQSDCFYLHQEIVFSPQALSDYADQLAKMPCAHGEYCKYYLEGRCFHNHDTQEGRNLGSDTAESVRERPSRITLNPEIKAEKVVPLSASAQIYRPPNRANELASAWAAEPTFRNPDIPYSDPAKPIDFIPLVKALHHLGETRFGNRVLRSTLGSALKLSPACPIGSPAYPDFRRYVELAERGGFVQSGYNKARDAWVRSTGKLERACAEF